MALRSPHIFRLKPVLYPQYRLRSTSSTVTKLTRKERRRLEREAKKIQAKNSKIGSTPESADARNIIEGKNYADSIRSRLNRLVPNPRIPGGARELLHSSHRKHLAMRFGLAIILFALIESEDTSPYCIDMAQGPSMLPTFATVGDIYLRETGAWSRLLGIPLQYERGDLIVFRDANGRYAGKRIIGIEGDEVLRYGAYAHMYLDRPDWGIAESVGKNQMYHNVDTNETDDRDAELRIKVPPNHVWLEGDFPPFSVDSRHYGPVPVDWIRGRILCRVWPLISMSGGLSRSRPEPLSVDVALSGKHNLHLNPMAKKREKQ